MKHALLALGYSTAHGGYFWFNDTVSRAWLAWLNGGDVEPALRTMLEQGFNATVDGPMNLAYREMMARFPDAKVVLTVRDSGAQWFESVRRLKAWTEAADTKADHQADLSNAVFRAYDCEVFGPERAATAERARRCAAGYERFVEEVKVAVPAERLLVYNTRDGWEPLCDFLGLPVPDAAFPHVKTLPPFMPEALTETWRTVQAWMCATFLVLALWLLSWRRRRAARSAAAATHLHGFWCGHALVLLAATCRAFVSFIWHVEQLGKVDA